MARGNTYAPTFLLGYEDELITDKLVEMGHVDYTTNKIGGKPDWPQSGVPNPHCRLCGRTLPLIVQIYAPPDGPSFIHRTLYLFGCVTPDCWNKSESWTCIRSQLVVERNEAASIYKSSPKKTYKSTDWVDTADDWGGGDDREGDEDDDPDDDGGRGDADRMTGEEKNGNLIGGRQRRRCINTSELVQDDNDIDPDVALGNVVDLSALSQDDDHQGNYSGSSTPGSPWHNQGNANLVVGIQSISIEDPNANIGGAAGVLHSPVAVAEIEADETESDMIAIDTPIKADTDITQLFQQASTVPQNTDPVFEPHFVAVYEESKGDSGLTEHEKQLLLDYQRQEGASGRIGGGAGDCGAEVAGDRREKGGEDGGGGATERYEKSLPAHADLMFHKFLTRIQLNPGQILRYCRDERGGMSSLPLLLYPLREAIPRCTYCGGETTFEMQVVPSLVGKLKLRNQEGIFLEFGTVLVYTCRRSCWDPRDSWRQEHVVVQAELV